MENTKDVPLTCLGVFPFNNTPPDVPAITTTTTRKANGSWETVAYVNGKFYSSCSSKNKQYNLDMVRQDLAEMDYKMPEQEKQLAPVMSARLPKKSNAKAA